MKGLRRKTATPRPDLLKGKTVCIVEDDSDQMAIIQSMLADSGCDLEIFSGGDEALQRLLKNPVDLILADVMMPGMDGWALHSQVRASGPNQQTPFIFTTCVIDKNQETLMTDIPARTLTLAKPFDRETLLRSVARVMA